MVYIGADTMSGAQLWIRDLNSLTGRPLPGTSGASAPFFSPDGQSVGFFTGNPATCASCPSTAGRRSPWSGTPPCRGGDWDESGHIYFTSNRAVTTRVPAGGGVAEAVSTLDSAKGVSEHDWAQVLPGGKRLLVQNWHNSIADAELAVLDLATGAATPIMQGVYGRYVPTGHIVYVTLTGSLTRVPFDPSAGKLTGAPLSIAEQVQIDGTSGSGQFSVSDNGTLAYMPGAGGERTGGLGRSHREADPGGHRVARPVLRGRPVAGRFAPRCRALGSDGEQIWVKRLPEARSRACHSARRR